MPQRPLIDGPWIHAGVFTDEMDHTDRQAFFRYQWTSRSQTHDPNQRTIHYTSDPMTGALIPSQHWGGNRWRSITWSTRIARRIESAIGGQQMNAQKRKELILNTVRSVYDDRTFKDNKFDYKQYVPPKYPPQVRPGGKKRQPEGGDEDTDGPLKRPRTKYNTTKAPLPSVDIPIINNNPKDELNSSKKRKFEDISVHNGNVEQPTTCSSNKSVATFDENEHIFPDMNTAIPSLAKPGWLGDLGPEFLSFTSGLPLGYENIIYHYR